MRRPPFQVNPLALSVALLLAAPVAAVAQDTPLTTNSSAVITNPVVVISGSGSITTNNIGNVTELSGVVSGTGQLVKQGDGTLSLTNNNTYQSTVIEQGTLSIKRASSLGDGDVTITEGSTLATQTSTTITNKINLTPETPVDNPLTTAATISTVGKENITQVTSSIAGSSGLIKSGDGTLSLTADNAYAGNTTIQQGTLAISREGSLGAGTAVSISNGAVLQTNKDVTISKDVILNTNSTIDTFGNNSKVTGNISGSGFLVKSGDGSLTLDTKVTASDGTVSYTGNSYDGGTWIKGGLLIVNDNKDLGKANTDVAITGGTLQIANDITLERNIITASSSGGSISTAGHNVVLDGAVLNANNTLGHLVKSGAGKLTLTSDQSNYNYGTATNGENEIIAAVGNTVINGGTLSVAKDEFLGIKQKQFSEGGLTKADWDRGNLLIDGGILETTAGFVTKRTVNIGAAGATIDVAGAANITTLKGLITGTGAIGTGDLIKEGDGTLIVSLDSTEYTVDGITIVDKYKENAYGKTIIKAGVLEVGTVEHDLAASDVELAGGNLKINGVSTLGLLSLKGTGGAIDVSGGTVNIGIITGASTAELKKKGSGTLVLNGTNNTYEGDTTISEGKVQIKDEKSLGANAAKLILDGGVLQVTAATNLVKDTTITTNNGTIDTTSQNVVLEGKVSGVGQLIKSGAGTLTLKNSANSGDNTFEGGVRIKEGALEVSTDSALGKDGGSVVIDGATLAITGTGDNTLKRSITLTEKGGTVSVAAGGKATLTGELQLDKDAISADLTKAGAGELALTKDNTTGKFKGNTIIKEGTLGVTSENNLAQGKLFLDGGNLRTNADVSTFSKDIILNSQGGVDTNGHDSRVQSTIQGDGTFVKSGEGELTLEGGNTYAGGTLIEGVGTVAAGHKASVLAVTNHANLGLNNTNITLDKEGELKLLANLDIGAADGRALIVGSGNGSLNTNGLDSTISSAIAGTGKLTKKGEGKLTLTANNLLTGGVVNNTQTGGITVEQGTLSISNDNNLGSVSAVLTLKTDATAATATTLEVTNNVSLNRQVVLAGGDITLAQGANTVTAGQAISGSGSITKTGTGDLTLDAANTYTGGTRINQGSVTLSKAVSSLGSGVVTLADGTTLNTLANVSIANKTELGGSVTVNTADQTSATFVSTAVISDASNSTGVLKKVLKKKGKGTLVLDSANTYSGGTQINDGRVAISQNAALSTGVVSLAATATLDATADVTLANEVTLAAGATVETSANLTLANTLLPDQVITLNDSANVTFNAKQSANSIVLESKVTGTGGVTKEGDGSLILKSANDYAGSTIVNKGTVVVASQGALSTGAVTLNAGTTLETANQVNLANAINLAGVKTDKVNLSVATDNNSTISGVISGTASLVKKGGGVLTLTGDSVTGVNTYTGDTIIEAGALAITSGANLGANGTNVTLQGGDLQLLKDDIQINGGSITTVANSSGGINTNGHNSTMNSTVKGDGTFVKKGDGTLTLEADNSALIGGVRVEKGTLAISQDASLGKSDAKLTLAGGILSVTKDVTLTREVSINTAASTIQTNANVTLAGLVSGDAQLVLEGGTFKLTHDNSYAGGTKVLNSTLTINNTKNLGAETGVLTLDNGTLQTTGDLVTSRQVTLNSALNILDSDTHAVTLAGEVSGSGSLVKNGSGDLTLSHQNTYTGDTTINGGKVTLDGNNASFGNGTVTFANATTLATSSNVTVANAVQLDGQTTLNTATANSSLAVSNISNAITGNTGSLIKTGIGTLTLNAENTYTGNTAITAGKVVLGSNAATLGVGGTVTLADATTLETSANTIVANAVTLSGGQATFSTVSANNSLTISKAIDGAGGLIKSGTGTLTLDAANTYKGGTTVNAGTVVLATDTASLGSGAVTLKAGTILDTAASLANAIQLTGDGDSSTKTDLVRLNVAQANSSTLSGIVTGDAGLIKDGIGQLTLTGDNSNYTGDIHVDVGTVSINNSHALGGSNTVSFATDTMLKTTDTVTLENNILLSGTGNTTLDSASHDSTFRTGTISGTGALTKQGTGKLTLEGNNTAYTGNVSIAAGTLVINNSNAVGQSNRVTFASSTTLETNKAAAVSLANTTIQLAGNTTVNNADTSSLTIANAITETATGSGLTKAGTGTLTLNGANSYTGNTSITGGNVVLGTNAATLGAGVVTLANATTLETSANAIVANAVTLSGGQATLSTVSANNSLTMNNTVNGDGGLIKAGAGTLTLNAENTYKGNTAITGGKVVLGNAATLGVGGTVTLADTTTLETSATATVANAIVLSGGQATVSTTVTGSSLTINQAMTGDGGLIKSGTGTLTLGSANTYTGGTTVNAGKVIVDHATALGSGQVVFKSGTELTTASAMSVENTLRLDGNMTLHSLANSTFTGNVSGTGNLTKDGVGTLHLEHANTGYTGSITINEGGLVVNNNSALGAGQAGQLTLATNTTLETANAVTLANKIQLAGDATLNSATHDSVLAGQITGVGKLIKEGDGSFTLSESNSYTGGTLIKAGTIVVNNDKSLGAKQAEFAANTTLKIDAASAISLANDIKLTDSVTVNSATNGVLSGVVSGAGSLTKVGVGRLTLNGVNTYTGATTIKEGGVVVINTAKSLGAGSQLAINNAALETAANIKLAQTVSLEGNATFNTTAKDKALEMTNVISGGGSLTKEGDGVLTLSQANTYKGNTAVNKGTVVVGNSTSFGLGTVTFAGATALEASTNITLANTIKFNGQTTLNSKLANMTLEVSNAITGDGSLVKSGEGHLKLNAANSYTGSTTINAGKVILGSSTASFGTGMVALANETALETSANVTLANAVQLNGQATVNTTLNASALAFSNTITGTGSLTKTGLGTLSLNGENTYKGGTTITEGNVIVSNNAALGEGSVIFSNNTGLETSTAVSLANAMRLDGKTTINTQTHNSRLMGVMSGTGDLTKIGTGSLALEANNSNYIGLININAGKLVINDSKALGSGAMTFATGTELATSKSIVVNNQMTLTGNVTVTNADALEIKSIKGAGSLTKSGSGDLTLNASNAHTGGTIINAGKLIVGNSAALGSGKASFADSTTLEASGIITLANKIDLVGSMTLNSDYEGSELNGVVLNGVMSGGKAGKLIKVGKGNLTLGGENTYSGGTVINTGKVIIGQNAALGTGSVTFGNNTMLEVIADASTVVTLDNIFTLNGSTTLINATNNTELKSVINGNGSLIKQGKGVLSLTAANTYAGGTTIQSGLVAIKQDDNLGTGLLTLNGGGLQFATASAPTFAHNVVVGVASGSIDTQANNITASGNISGSGKLTKLGAGLLTLSGDNTAYTGSLSIEAGTLGVVEQKNLGTSELTIKNAAIKTNANLVNAIKLAGNAVFDTSSSIIASGVIGGSGSLIKTGEGNLELSGVNDYSGNTILKEGMLTLSQGANLGLSNLQVQGGKLSLKDGFVSQGELIQDTKDAIVIAAGSNNTFSKTTVNSGALVVDGTLTSPITISVGGSLRGSGKVVGNTVVEGTLSPGNSPGIFAVKGNLTHKPTTTLEIEIDGAGAGTGAGKHDQVLVDGNFTADGSLVAKLRNITGTATNQFVPSVGQSFEVVKANAVNGVFASYTAPTEGLATGTRLDVGYTPTSVRLYVTPESYSAVVSGENRVGVSRFLDAAINIERSSTEGLKRLAEGTTDLAKLYQALIPANTQMINDALVSMSPAIYAESAQSVLAIQQSLHNTQTLSESFKKGGVAVKLLQQDTDVDSDGNGIAATRSISGVQLAVDSEPYNNGWQMGATVSVINKGDITGQGAALDLTGQDISLALRKQTKNWLLVGELDIGSYQLDAKRNVILGSSTFANAQDGINAKTYGFGLSASRAISDDWQVVTGLRYNNVNQSSFAEVGNSLLRLTVDKVQQNQVVAMMGANWSQSFAAANWKVMPKLGLQLEQTLMGDTAQAEATLSTQRLSSQASDTGKSLFRAMVGVSATHQSGLTVGVDAASEQGSNASGTTGRLSLSKSF